jgi:hypothetical protein
LRRLVFAGWDDVPHLTPEMRETQLRDMDPHLRDARTRGIPFLGSGAVYPIQTDVIEVKPFAIPDHWVRGFGMDVGWNKTAAIWGAHDRESDIVYLYDEHYVGEEHPQTHVAAIRGDGTTGKFRGKWIPGVIDPASKGKGQADGIKLLDTYKSLGLDLETAINAVEAGVRDVRIRISSGRLKVFSTCSFWFKEYLLYRRDKNGQIIQNKARPDHLMDATRYLIVSGLMRMRDVPYEKGAPEWGDRELVGASAWMGV